MKKTLVISLLALLAVATVSCSRKRNCICTQHYEGAATSWDSLYGDTIFKESKKQARALCDGLDGEVQFILTEKYWLDCELEKDME